MKLIRKHVVLTSILGMGTALLIALTIGYFVKEKREREKEKEVAADVKFLRRKTA